MKTYRDFGIEVPYGRFYGQIKTYCPQCRDKRTNKRDKSLSVDLANGVWHCHYCGWADCLPREKEMNTQTNAFRRPQKPVYKLPKATGQSQLSQKALAWFKSRGISEETLTKMRITEGKEFMPQKGEQVNTIQFNYYKDGQLVNTKFRTGDKCFKLVPGAELLPYNLDAIKDSPTCCITEGEIDTLSFVECGRMDVVSVPNGANANLQYLDDYIESHFEDKETIFIASDTDTKGLALRDELIRRFGADKCRIVSYGDGCKDANEHLQKYGKESLLQCLEYATEPKVEGIFCVSDLRSELDALFRNGMQKGYTIGDENLDKLISFETKRLCIVTGIPSSGKSAFLNYFAMKMNIRYDWRFAFYSPESWPLHQHIGTITELFTGKKFNTASTNDAEYQQALNHLDKSFFFIAPEDDVTLDSILEKAKILIRRKGIKALIIDPYNRVEHNYDKNLTETQAVSKFLDKLTSFAQRYDILVILMAHPAKMPKNRDGVEEIPTLYDISGSANFFNKADFGIVVHRDRLENITKVLVKKVKFRHLGENGEAHYKFNLNNGRYVPYEGESYIPYDNRNYIIDKYNAEAVQEAFDDFPSDDFQSDFS